VPVAVSDELRAAHPDLVEEVRVEGAGHVRSWNAEPAAYQARETAFLSCVGSRTSFCPGAGLRTIRDD
jgi:uncharacterized protein